MEKVRALVRKEWSQVFKNRLVVFAVSFLPLLFTALPLIILYTTRQSGDLGEMVELDMPGDVTAICGELRGAECGQYFVVSQFMLLFMIIPVMIPVTIASYSIVGEKTTRTLEPLLATPITTMELLGGKALAAVLPAVLVTWGAYLLFTLGARLLAVSPRVVMKLFDPLWLLAIFLVGPLLSLASVSLAVMISSRVNEPRVAEQISGLLVLPVVGLLIAQSLGALLINEEMILWMAGGLLVVDVGLLAFAVQLFQRETILTRWK